MYLYIYIKNYYIKKQKTNLSIETLAKSTNRHFTEETQMANKYMKRCSTTLVITEKQIKTTVIKTLGLQKLDV